MAGEEIAVTPDHCWGNRDRSWGCRPVGEPEPDGIREGEMVLPGMWNYFPMQFDDHAIFYICHERDDGDRPLVQAERVWADPGRPIDELGPVEHEHRLVARAPGSSPSSVLAFPEAGIEIDVPAAPGQLRLGGHRLRHRRRLAPRHVPRPRAA